MSKEMMTMITTIVVAIITAIVGPILLEWFRNKFNKKKPKAVHEAITFNAMVDEQLSQLMDDLNCNNIWIAQFHNGGNFYPTKKSIQKFSVFYEKVSYNTFGISPILQNIPASLFPKALDKVNTESYLEILDVEASNEFYGLETIITQLKAKSLYLFGIYSLNDVLIGVLGISYNDKVVELTDEDHSYISQKLGAVGTLLTNYLYKLNEK
jgi:hypothetical protein